MDEFVLFAFLLFTANKSNWSVHFLGESTAGQSAFRFYLTFSRSISRFDLEIKIKLTDPGKNDHFPSIDIPFSLNINKVMNREKNRGEK